ncbi:MAG: hypothetical protein KC731_28800, partial [Myxococcales bacterium]|nr:hypothetical protein [Myxococcales bacterium]
CNVGRCAATGALCVLNTCSPAECTPFTCITAGEGDAEAYCTHHDCDDDSECPSGFFCGETRDPRDVCNTTKGSANLCGDNVADPCLDPASFMDNGAQFFEGSVCLLRKTCLKREDCNPCTTNLDCSWGQAQVCTTHAGANVCARLCTGAADCKKDETCAPYAAATLGSDKTGFCQDTPGVACGSAEDCGGGACLPVTGTCAQAPGFDCAQDADCVTAGDVCVPRSVCVPSSGACDASDAPGDKFCFHCTKDSDCGDASSSMACVDAGRGQLACLDLAFSTSCMADTDCPAAPSGLRGECLDEQEGVSPSSSVYHRCYFPFDDGEQAFTCW